MARRAQKAQSATAPRTRSKAQAENPPDVQEVAESDIEDGRDEKTRSRKSHNARLKTPRGKAGKGKGKAIQGELATDVTTQGEDGEANDSSLEEEENAMTMYTTPDEGHRQGSVELGESSAPQERPDTSATSTSSIFDQPESTSSTPVPEPVEGQKRKRKDQDESSEATNDRSTKRTKTATPDTSEEDTTQTPAQKKSKKTYRGSKRTRKASPAQNSEEADQPPNDNTPTATALENDDSDAETSRPRKARRSSSTTGATGHFTQEEMDELDQFRQETCTEYGISINEFNELINLPKGAPWPNPNIAKDVLLSRYYDVLPYRNKRSMRRYKERWFKNTMYKPHKWSNEQDRELARLVQERGQRWVEIATLLGRTQDEVAQHFHNKVQYQDKQSSGHWTSEEVKKLRDAVFEAKKRLGVAMGPETDHEIRWSVISDMLDNTRTRQQCSLRWRRERRIESMGGGRRKEKLDKPEKRSRRKQRADDDSDEAEADADPSPSSLSRVKKAKKAIQRAKSSQKRSKKKSEPEAISEEFVHDDDEESNTGQLGTTEPEAIPADGESESENEDEMSNSNQPGTTEPSVIQADESEPENDTELANAGQPDTAELEVEQADGESELENDEDDDSEQEDEIEPANVSQPTSKNPFDTIKTPLKMSQLFTATQANSSDVKPNQYRSLVEDTPVNPPERPSPNVPARFEPETPTSQILKNLAAPVEENESAEEADEEDEEEDGPPPQTFSSKKYQDSSSDEEEEEEEEEEEGEEGLEYGQGTPQGKDAKASTFQIYEDASVSDEGDEEEEGDGIESTPTQAPKDLKSEVPLPTTEAPESDSASESESDSSESDDSTSSEDDEESGKDEEKEEDDDEDDEEEDEEDEEQPNPTAKKESFIESITQQARRFISSSQLRGKDSSSQASNSRR